jgi:hypothetical protein
LSHLFTGLSRHEGMSERLSLETDLYRLMIKVAAGGLLLASACSAEVAVAAERPAAHVQMNPDLRGRISQ